MTFLARIQAEFGQTLSLAFSDLDKPAAVANLDADTFRAARIEQTARLAPLLIAANAALGIGIPWLADGYYPDRLLWIWSWLALVPSALIALEWLNDRLRSPRRDLTVIRRWEAHGAILGIVWAAFLALFFDTADGRMLIFSIASALAIYGVGALVLARIPTAAILFCTLIGSALTLNLIKLGGRTGFAFAGFWLFYSVVVAAIILVAHRRALLRAAGGGEMRKQKEIISLLLNDFELGASDWLWETDCDGHLIHAADRLSGLTSKPPADLIGKSLAEAAGINTEDAGWKKLAAAMKKGSSIDDCEVEIVGDGGSTWWQIVARPVLDDNGQFSGHRGVARDITAARNARLELVQAKEMAERASASKSQFLAVMSHELKTPLNAIVGFAELLNSEQADYLTDTTKAGHLRTILDSGRHLQALINDILDATRIEKGVMRLVEQEGDAAELVEVAVKLCRDVAEKSDVVIIARVAEGIEIKGDILRIKQVLINLISNAAKFSTPGGFVNVGLEKAQGSGLAFTVSDAGCGIRADDLERIFEPFVQAENGMDRRFGGIGLGLAIARKIALLHGGDITLESRFGEGTTARLILPPSRVAWPASARATAAA